MTQMLLHDAPTKDQKDYVSNARRLASPLRRSPLGYSYSYRQTRSARRATTFVTLGTTPPPAAATPQFVDRRTVGPARKPRRARSCITLPSGANVARPKPTPTTSSRHGNKVRGRRHSKVGFRSARITSRAPKNGFFNSTSGGGRASAPGVGFGTANPDFRLPSRSAMSTIAVPREIEAKRRRRQYHRLVPAPPSARIGGAVDRPGGPLGPRHHRRDELESFL